MGIHPGASIGANVRLIRPLSRGGMGSVWRAEHLTLHTEVAVKFVSDALIGDQGFLARFTREAVASARIKSPHVVQIFDHGVTADGVPYIVMELLEGEDLRTRLLRVKKLPLADAVKVVTQVARGLSRAHAAGVVHRDVKPGNIFLVDHDGELFVKILDFGIAKQVGDVDHQVTMTGQIIGTPHYVSPEQIQRPREADPQSDLWSLAVVAYRCLTGELPFEGESVGAVAIAIDKAAFARVTDREPALPRMLDAWFEKAFARAPSSRFRSAKELAAAFEAAARGEPLSSVLVDSTSFSLRDAAGAPLAPLAPVARLAAPVADVTPGAVDLAAAPRPDDRAPRPEDRTTRPELPDAPPPAAAAAPTASATDTPRRADTPLTMGEPTLSHGTVTHIELTNPRRTKLYGGMIVGIGLVGAIVVGILSRGDDAAGPGAASAAADTASAAPAAAPTAAATASAAASASAAPTAPSSPAASTAGLTAQPASTAAPPAPSESAAAPPTTAAPPSVAPGPTAPAIKPGGAAPAGTSTRTKNRGF